MTYLLDTNACIGYLNGTAPGVLRRLQRTSPEDVVLCSIVRAELLYGASRKGVRSTTLPRLRSFLVGFRSLPFDDAAADAYGDIRARLVDAATPIGPNDLIIAATALSHRLTLVTHNVREFARVEGLLLEDWEVSP